MKKTLILAAVVALTISSTGLAQDSTLFFDIRDNTSPNQLIQTPTYPYTVAALNGGMAGDAQTLFVTAVHSTSVHLNNGFPNNDADGNNSTGSFWLYMDVNNAAGGGTGVISSIGLDMPITPPATPRNQLGSVDFGWVTTGSIVWSGSSDGTSSTTGVVDAKAVKVPVVAGSPNPVFDATGGLVPVNRYRVGRLDFVGGTRNCTYGAGHTTNSTYTLKMAVDGLLITRVFNGAVPDPTEDVAFGYAAGLPESPYVDGSVPDGTSAMADATIIIAAKGDNNGDGRILTNDQPGFIAARNAGTAGATQLQVFLNDFNGDRRVLTNDQPGFITARNNSGTCP